MRKLGNVDLALLPCGGFYTMDMKDAKEAVLAIKPASRFPCTGGTRT